MINFPVANTVTMLMTFRIVADVLYYILECSQMILEKIYNNTDLELFKIKCIQENNGNKA